MCPQIKFRYKRIRTSRARERGPGRGQAGGGRANVDLVIKIRRWFPAAAASSSLDNQHGLVSELGPVSVETGPADRGGNVPIMFCAAATRRKLLLAWPGLGCIHYSFRH